MAEKELKHCPFCNGKATLHEQKDSSSKDFSYIECERCHCKTRKIYADIRYCANNEAANMWNMRA